jgi:hypothetical protein
MQELRTTFEGNVPPAANSSIGGTELWLAPAWTMLPLARRLCRVRNPINEVVAQLTSDQFAVLTACEGCKTIDEHGAGVRQKLGVPDHDWPVIREWLGKFATLGLLVSLGELIKRLDPTSDRLPAPFAGVFIRTRDRPPLLKRALGSAAAIEQHNAARHRYHVLDDSRDPDAIARNRDAVAGSGLDIAHHVLSDEHALVRALLSEFPSARDAIRWLLGGHRSRPGASRFRRRAMSCSATGAKRNWRLPARAPTSTRSPPICKFSVRRSVVSGTNPSATFPDLMSWSCRGTMHRASCPTHEFS